MKVCFRVDASSFIGSGHIMRCIALAEELNTLGSDVEFITRNYQGNLNGHIKDKGFKISSITTTIADVCENINDKKHMHNWSDDQIDKDVKETIQILNNNKPDWIIVDNYSIDIRWENKIRPYVDKIMVIDDLANRQHNCDLLLDQNYTNNRGRYNNLLNPSATKLIGPKYVLLRKEFSVEFPEVKKNKQIENIFIFFGGSDPDNITCVALKALSRCNVIFSNIDVVIGSSNYYKNEVAYLVNKMHNAKLYEQVDNISDLMRKADIALGAGGTSNWERMVVGLPSIVVTIADNQIPSTRDLDKDNYLTWIGSSSVVGKSTICKALSLAVKDMNNIKNISQRGKNLVNKHGSSAVAKILFAGPDKDSLFARKAVYSDNLLYWHWVNDSDVRDNSFKAHKIRLKDHKKWFKRHLDSPDTIMLVIESNISEIGQVRFDNMGSYYIVDYSISRQFRGFGFGATILSKAIDWLKTHGSFILIGEVKSSNIASQKALKRVGFTDISSKSNSSVRCYKLKC